jgi:hypothetical protein
MNDTIIHVIRTSADSLISNILVRYFLLLLLCMSSVVQPRGGLASSFSMILRHRIVKCAWRGLDYVMWL